MVGIFIMLIVTISLVAGAGASMFYLLSATQASLAIQQNQMRVQAVASSVRSNIAYINGNMAVPVDDAPSSLGSNEYLARVPSLASFQQTTFGSPIVYCPVVFGAGQDPADASVANGALANEVSAGVKETYPIQVVLSGGRKYVTVGYPEFVDVSMQQFGAASGTGITVAERLNSAGIYGFILSGTPNRSADLKCSQIKYASGDNFLIDGGSVQPLYADVVNAPPSKYVIDPTPDSVLSDKSTRQVESLSAAIDMARHFGQQHIEIEVASDIEVTSIEMQSLASYLGHGQVTITGNSPRPMLTMENPSINVEGNLTVSNVELSASDADEFGIYVLPTGKLSLERVSLSYVHVRGGVISISNGTQVRATTSDAVVNRGGQVIIGGGDSSIIKSTSGYSINTVSGETTVANGTELNQSVSGVSKAYAPLQRAESDVCVEENGVTTCEAACLADTRVKFGECASLNDAKLVGFYASTDGTKYICKFAANESVPPAVGYVYASGAKAQAVCAP